MHRVEVEAYRAARQADLEAEEAVTLGYEEETRLHRERYGPPVCFKAWLTNNA